MFFAGQQFGPYYLINKLGRGGFGEVWLAEKRSEFLTRKVAVKLPHDDQVDFEAIRREASLWDLASGHPNVLPIIDADVFDGQVLIVSEYADGGTLSDRLQCNGAFSDEDAIACVSGILRGLEFLHSKNIIHRDIKPQNVLLQGNTPRLADFGISRSLSTTSVSSMIMGTDAYMAPEAFEGKRNVQTDLWAVGIVLYQLLSNSLPFAQNHPSERMFAILTKEYSELSNHVPHYLKAIIAKALSKAPETRFSSAAEMLQSLSATQSNHSTEGKLNEPTKPSPTNVETRTVVRSAERIIPISATPRVVPNTPLVAKRGLYVDKVAHVRTPLIVKKSALGLDANIAAGIAYIPFCGVGILMSIIVLVSDKTNKLARFHAIQSLLLFLTWLVGYVLVMAIAGAASGTNSQVLSGLTVVLYFAVVFGLFGAIIVSCVKAFKGEIFKLPVLGNLADNWSN